MGAPISDRWLRVLVLLSAPCACIGPRPEAPTPTRSPPTRTGAQAPVLVAMERAGLVSSIESALARSHHAARLRWTITPAGREASARPCCQGGSVTVLDLFSGIGGMSLGLESIGFRTVAFCEVEPFCREVLAHHWPGVPIHEDVRTLRGPMSEKLTLWPGFPRASPSASRAGAREKRTPDGCGPRCPARARGATPLGAR